MEAAEQVESQPRVMRKADFARLVGVSQARLRELELAGRIVVREGLVDVAQTRMLLAATGQTQSGSRIELGNDGDATVQALARARLRAEEARATKLELEVAVAAGELVRRDDVELEAADMGARLQDALMQLPDALAAELVGRDVEQIQDALEAALRAVLERLAQPRAEQVELGPDE